MAEAPRSPWSRWDAPGYQYVSNQTEPPYSMQHDTGFENAGSQYGNSTLQRLVASRLLEQRANPNDANFVECIYAAENSASRFVEQCGADVGCCETTCCRNHTWQEEYAWAVALIVIFCVLVLLSLAMTLFCWLYNRAKDKRQKRLISESMGGMSPAVSQANVTGVEDRNESGYYPYVGGPNHY